MCAQWCPSMIFTWQENWNGLPLPPPGDLPDARIKPASPAAPALVEEFFTTEPLDLQDWFPNHLALGVDRVQFSWSPRTTQKQRSASDKMQNTPNAYSLRLSMECVSKTTSVLASPLLWVDSIHNVMAFSDAAWRFSSQLVCVRLLKGRQQFSRTLNRYMDISMLLDRIKFIIATYTSFIF